jgi:hypothetical protein
MGRRFWLARALHENSSPKHDPAWNNTGRTGTTRRWSWVGPQIPARRAPGMARKDGPGKLPRGGVNRQVKTFSTKTRSKLSKTELILKFTQLTLEMRCSKWPTGFKVVDLRRALLKIHTSKRYKQIFHAMVRECRTQTNTMSKNTRDTRFIPRFGHTTKVPYSLLRRPQRAGSLSTLILSLPTTKVKPTQ